MLSAEVEAARCAASHLDVVCQRAIWLRGEALDLETAKSGTVAVDGFLRRSETEGND